MLPNSKASNIKQLVCLLTLLLLPTTCCLASTNDQDMQAFLKAHNCMTCHTVTNKIVGPSFQDIASRYSATDEAKIAHSIRNGSENTWGPLPMPPFRILSEVQAQCVAEWVLSLKVGNYSPSESCHQALEVPKASAKPGSATPSFSEKFILPEMVVVPAGSFMMGSPADESGHEPDETPVHLVTFEKSFEVGKYEVTFDEWDHCVADGGCKATTGRTGKDFGWGRGKQPVIGVNLQNVRDYIKWLNEVSGKHFRLLTEAEWEYAARAGTATRYYWGNDVGRDNANCRECGNAFGGQRPVPVGSFKPNAFGLYDMLGNVREWTEDHYQGDYRNVPTDGSPNEAMAVGTYVMRGGSWNALANDIRSAFRDHNYENAVPDDKTGFRLARTLP